MLSEKVEAHTGGDDWALRVEIAEALGWTHKQVGGVVAWYSPDQPDTMKAGPPKWLTSLDAAMTLVQDGWAWTLYSDASCEIGLIPAPGYLVNPEYIIDAATPALALTAAALKARGL